MPHMYASHLYKVRDHSFIHSFIHSYQSFHKQSQFEMSRWSCGISYWPLSWSRPIQLALIKVASYYMYVLVRFLVGKLKVRGTLFIQGLEIHIFVHSLTFFKKVGSITSFIWNSTKHENICMKFAHTDDWNITCIFENTSIIPSIDLDVHDKFLSSETKHNRRASTCFKEQRRSSDR